MTDKILVVDDEPDTLDLTRMILEGIGYKVVLASDGDEALQKINSEIPDLILLDCVMPGKSGIEVCKIIKIQSKTKFIPVVMFTALGREVDKKLAKDAGADGHLVKPFEEGELATELKMHLEKVRPEKFSRALGISHSQLDGRKLLLEFDPADPYERIVRDFALEAKAHKKTPIIITLKSSTIYQTLQEERDLEFALMTDTVLTPVLDAHAKKSLAVIYDNLTELIISMGFQPAFNFIRKTLDLLTEYGSTALFLLNPSAHRPNETNAVRNIFGERVAFGKDGLTKIKMT